jgi:hypothetical protein
VSWSAPPSVVGGGTALVVVLDDLATPLTDERQLLGAATIKTHCEHPLLPKRPAGECRKKCGENSRFTFIRYGAGELAVVEELVHFSTVRLIVVLLRLVFVI